MSISTRRIGWVAFVLILIAAPHLQAQPVIGEPSAAVPRANPGGYGMSVADPYLGAQVGYMLTRSGDFVDGLLAAVAYKTRAFPIGPFQVPVLANLDFAEILTQLSKDSLSLEQARERISSVAATRRGAVVGLYPYLVQPVGSDFDVVIHGMAGYKGNVFGGQPGASKDDTKAMLHQARVSAGVEVLLRSPAYTDAQGSSRAIVAGIAPAYHFFSADRYEQIFGERRSSLFVWETHGILPIPGLDKFALLAEYTFGGKRVFGDESVSGGRVGVLFVSPR